MQGDRPSPRAPGNYHVPGQIPAPLPGLVLDIQLFPLGAQCLESKAWSLGLPRQTLALGSAALACPLQQALARAPLACMLGVPFWEHGHPAGENRDLMPL